MRIINSRKMANKSQHDRWGVYFYSTKKFNYSQFNNEHFGPFLDYSYSKFKQYRR